MQMVFKDRRTAMFGVLATCGALSFAAGAALAQQGPGVTDKEIKIGSWMVLTGPIATYGVPHRAGVDAYLNLVNDRGGVKGRKIVLTVEDNAFNPQRTVTAARKLISRDDSLAILAPTGTGPTAAAFDYVLGDSKVPVINTSGGAANWYDPPRENLFGALVLYENQLRALGRWAAKDGHKHIIVVHPAGASFESNVVHVAPGAKSVRSDANVELYPAKLGTTDYGPIALDIAGKKPDAVMLILGQPEVIALAKELRQQGVRPGLYTFAPVVANSVLELGGPAVEGMYAVSYTVPVTHDTPAVREYRDALAKYAPGEKPDYVSFTGFALAKIFVEAVRRIDGPINRPSLVKALYSLRNYDTGIIPPVSYAPNRHLGATTLQRVVAKGGKWEPVGSPIDSEKDW